MNIVCDCSVEAEIRVNFEVFASRPRGAVNREGNCHDLVWRFVPVAELQDRWNRSAAAGNEVQTVTTTGLSSCDIQQLLPAYAPETGAGTATMAPEAAKPEPVRIEESIRVADVIAVPEVQEPDAWPFRPRRRKRARVVEPGTVLDIKTPRLVPYELFDE